MDPPSRSTHAIFPHDDRTNPAEDGTQAKMDGVTLAHPIHGEPAKKRRRYNSRKTPAEWDLIKADLKKLYVDEDRSLEETIAELQANRGFEASKDQFKSKIKAWDLDKKIKTQEMKHIVRIDKKRLPKKTSFTVRKQPVSRFKIERFKKGHPAIPEPSSRTPSVIDYRTSYSPEGTPSLAITVSPRLGNFEWYRSYEEYRNQAPEYSTHPAFDILQKLRIQENTWQLRMFSKSQFLVFNTLLEQASPETLEDVDKNCPGCLSLMITRLYGLGRDIYENDPDSLSAEPDLRWWISQLSRIFQSRVEIVSYSAIFSALQWSLSEGIAIAADVFYEVGLELCRAEELEDWDEIHSALDMVDHLILSGRLQAGEAILKAIMKKDFDIIDVPSRNAEWYPQWDDGPMRSLYWRRAVTQLVIIRWFLAHPDIEHNVFGYNGSDFAEEDKTTRDLIEGIIVQESDRVHMLALRSLSRYLPRYGHSLGISAAAQDSEKQEEAEKGDENGIKDQGGIPFTGLQFEQHPPDRGQEEFGRWIAGSQGASMTGYEGSSSTFDGYHGRPRASGYVLEMGDLGLGEEGMRTDNEAFAERRGDSFRNNPTSTGQWTDFSSQQANQAGFMPAQTQFTSSPSANYLIDPPPSMSMFPGLQSMEQMLDRDLNEEQTRMDIDPDFSWA
ncbi:MAG: hypothetical protein Q9208_002304 [Pyrenodesmia sp. 3 TL-2023]